jgi:general secretion pathway protein J
VRGCRIRGFTLLELLVSLGLLALMSAVVYGSLALAAESWDRGEAKTERTRQMRLAQEFLWTTLTAAQPIASAGVAESPVPFVGAADSVAFPGMLPDRIGGGLYYFRLALKPADKDFQLTLSRVIPTRYSSATQPPEFRDAEVSILADGIRSMKVQYFGSTYQSGPDPPPSTWRDQWDDRLQWPVLVRVDVTPAEGREWPPLIVELRLAAQTVCDEIRRAHNQCDAN